MKEGKEYGRKQEFKAEIPILLKKNRFCSNKKTTLNHTKEAHENSQRTF